MDAEVWWNQLVAVVREAEQLELASYMFDDPALYEVCSHRLSDNTAFTLEMCLDLEVYTKGTTPKLQRSRVHQKGAAIYLCRGMGRLGAYPVKELVVDRRLLFTGSANFTAKSRSNRERCYKMTGAVVAQALHDIAEDKKHGNKLT